jgi:hypothetical protein
LSDKRIAALEFVKNTDHFGAFPSAQAGLTGKFGAAKAPPS